MTACQAAAREPQGTDCLREEHLRRLTCCNTQELATSASMESTPTDRASPLSSDGPSAASVVDFALTNAGKSAKRKATEALLASKFGRVSSSSSIPSTGVGTSAPGSAHVANCSKDLRADSSNRPPVVVQGCRSNFPAKGSGCTTDNGHPWCDFKVSIPAMDWPAALRPVSSICEIAVDSTGLQHLPGNVSVRIVTRPEQMPSAIKALRNSMQDGLCAIDLEWRPDGYMGNGRSSTRVALMQLASATMCVLVRTCRLPTLPPSLLKFFSDPSITLVGYSWDGSDEAKLQATYGFGRQRFARFLDLQQISERLGYHGYGLGALTQQVLGFEMPKSRKVTMSNWEAGQLSPQQIQYAALDAIITGHILRGLRLWHASPTECASCRNQLGKELVKPCWRCLTCTKDFGCFSAAQSHVQSKKHAGNWKKCLECGRVGAC